MSIKYHEYGFGNEYGTDHTLTNNWNPDLDYGNEYVKVYFNIDTPTYDCNNGWETEERDAWNKESSKLIRLFGGCGYDAEKAKFTYLDAHPQQISGIILKNDVKKVAEAISNMKLSSIRWVDLHETIYDISDSEYEEYLNEKRDEIRKELFEKSVTTRTNKYCAAFDVARHIANIIRLNRLGLNDGKNFGSGQTIEYILKVVDEMIIEGYLKYFERDGIKYIRSLNKTEQKQSKLSIT
jgi:hypothetical protein